MKLSKEIIKLEAVKKVYHLGEVDVFALRGVNLDVKRGEFLAVMGPSGSGKSTCMNMIGCLDIPTSGRIFLDGVDIARLSESELSQIRGRKIGFVFQQFNLISSLNALENVMLPMMFQQIPRDKRLKRAKELLTSVGIPKRMFHKPSELSGGERQRVAIARALANNPDVILADEPTGNLDSHSGRVIMDLLTDLHKSGKTIVMVTHDAKLSTYADRIAYILDGKIVGEKLIKKRKRK
ncbi:MAG: ATP-binding cassette domain-containing protein [Nitrospiraceae bacterium]|nr:ATP-binding cassette domain-containing protein [Nitrospiraceae bacterium]